ncbi:MAG: GntR family transcriptional regulator [Candidatus Bipolaricaulota bacterium]
MPRDGSEIEAALNRYAASERSLLAADSSIPLYYQLYRFLKRFIEQTGLEQGERFPSEEAIATTFGVSRPTANRAVEELVTRGWLSRERGRGTFIHNEQLGSLALLSDNLSLTEQFPPDAKLKTQFIERRVGPGNPTVAGLLALPAEAPILYFRRLRFVNDLPVMVCDSYLPADRFRNFTKETFVQGSLYATLEQVYGFTIERSERKISAQELVDQTVGDLLGVPVFSPVLLFTGLTFVRGEATPLEYMSSYVRECVTFSNTVRRDGVRAPAQAASVLKGRPTR